VIAISCGGVAPAEIIGKALVARLFILTACHSSTSDVSTPATGAVTCDPPPDLANTLAGHDCIVIVDDICGTGATLDAATQLVRGHRPNARLITATLCRNTGSSMVPDYYAWDVTDWVAFPWEQPPPPGHPTQPLPPCIGVHRRD
jgi:hypoxanthine phosphoribosyltransferase